MGVPAENDRRGEAQGFRGPVIRVVGVGGGGCNAVTRMVREGIRAVDFVAMNTDAKALGLAEAPTRIQLGTETTKGLGAGGDPAVGARAAEESREEIRCAVNGADMVFVAAGMGGGTGTGAAPIVAETAKDCGCLTVTVATEPFSFEGRHRRRVAEQGLKALEAKTDALIVVPNDRLLQVSDSKVAVDAAFRLADDVLCQAVKAICEVITVPGLINVDFAGVRSIMKGAGRASISVGMGSGQNRAVDAARSALASPLVEAPVQASKAVLFTIAGGDLTLFEVNGAAQVISQALAPEANVIFGVTLDPRLENEAKVTLIAAGASPGPGV